MSKKNPWVLGLSMAALVLAPTLHSAESAESKAPAKTEARKTEPAKTEASAPEKSAAADKPAADVAKVEKAEEKTAAKEGQAKKVSSDGHKSKALAGGLAFFPGVVVHGAGHMYGGSWMKGLGLLAIEGATIGIAVANVSTIQADVKSISDTKGIPTDLSVPYTKIGILSVCTFAFLWSWFDDMAGAPIAVGEYNKLVDQGNSAQLRLAPRGDGAQVALSTEF